jgi:CHAT domain-containing protein
VHGDFAGAAAQAAKEADRFRGNLESPWYWRYRLLEAEALIQQSRYADVDVLLRDAIPSTPGLADERLRLLVDRATVQINRRRDAADIIGAARQLPASAELAVRLDLIEGVSRLNRDQDREAREMLLRALTGAEHLNDAYYQASALSNLSIVSKHQNRYEESVEYGLRALAAAERAGARRVIASSHVNLGSSYAYLGDFPAALRHEEQALRMAEAIGARASVMSVHGELGFIEDLAGELAKAIPHLQTAYQMARELDRKADAARFAEGVALEFIKTKQWDEAADWNRRAEELAGLTGESVAYLERNRALISRATGHPEEAARIAKALLADPKAPQEMQWVAHGLLGRVEGEAGHLAPAGAEFAKALASIEGAQSALADSQHKITLLSYLIPFYQDYVQVLAEQNDDAGALRVVESSRGRVLAERMGRNLQAGAAPPLSAVRQFARQVNASVLTFWLAPEHSYAWLIRPEGVWRFSLPPAEQVQAMVTSYRKIVEHSVQDPLTSADPTLWDKVMARIAVAIPKGSRVIVIPDGPLHRLNLETLVVPGPTPHYWIEDAEIAVAPSIAIAMAASPASHPDRGMLAIGDPDYRGTGYDPLPAASREVRDVMARFGGPSPTAITGAKASPAAYRQAQPERFTAIHFAAHAEANEERPLESAVILSRSGDSYRLFARDVVDVPIHAELVTLSACRSAGAREYAGEGLIGFAWAFLQAGARTVVAGLWDVSDVSAGPLMARFYEGVNASHDPVKALREAKLTLLHGGARFQKAFYWGAFQTYVGAMGSGQQ